MSLYALGDLHLHFQSELKNPSQLYDKLWKDHEHKFKANCAKCIKEDDTLVLVGDHSWGRNLTECEEDLRYIMDLPGRKILLRGNHDMFWDAKRTDRLNDFFENRLHFLQNNYYSYEDYALVGTKGYCFEGPFYLDAYGHIIGWDEANASHAEKLVGREIDRLRISFEKAWDDGFRKFIMFLHYPPTNVLQRSSAFTRMAEEYEVEQVIYAHCHGESRFHDSLMGKKRGVRYSLVSGDYLRWNPMRVLT